MKLILTVLTNLKPDVCMWTCTIWMTLFAASRKWSRNSKQVFINQLNFRPKSVRKHNSMGHLLPCAIDFKTNHPPIHLQWIGILGMATELRHVISMGPRQPTVLTWPPPCPISCSGIRTPIGRTVWVTRKRRSIYYVRISFSIRHIDSCLLVVQHIIITCVYECSATLPPHFLIPVYEYKAILDFSTQYICIYQQHNIWIKLMDINQIQVNWKSKFYFGIFKRIYEIIRTKLIIFFRVVID